MYWPVRRLINKAYGYLSDRVAIEDGTLIHVVFLAGNSIAGRVVPSSCESANVVDRWSRSPSRQCEWSPCGLQSLVILC